MTPAPHLVVIALAANELSSPRTSAILDSAQQVLGPTVTVRVELIGDTRHPAADAKPSGAYARLAWDERDPRVAHLRCFIPESDRWVQRDVTFEDQDPERERGRTLGFVIGSIFIEARESKAETGERVPPLPQKNAQAKPKRLQLAAAASIAGPGDVTSIGAWLGAERVVSEYVSLGLGGEVRIGTVDDAQAGTRYYALGGTATLRLLPRIGPAWMGVRTLFGAEYFTITHRSEDDPAPVRHSAVIPRLDLLLHGSLELEGSSVLFFDVGTNYRFGSAQVYVHERAAAHIPAFVGIGRIGIGTRF